MSQTAPESHPTGLAMDLGRRIAQASYGGVPARALCEVVVDVSIAACRAAGMDQADALALFAERASRPAQAVPQEGAAP